LCVTVCDPINPVVNPIPVYSHLTRDIIGVRSGIIIGLFKSIGLRRSINWKMDPSEMEQIMGRLLAGMEARMEAERKAELKANQHEMKAQIGGLASRMDADKAEAKREREADKAESKAERKADKEEMMARMDNNKEEMIKAITGTSRESTEACDGKTKALLETTEAYPEVTHACLEEEKESTPKETDAVEEPQVVPEGATDEEKFGATEDRTGELRLVVRRHRQRKKWAQENGGPWQKFAAFRRWFTHRGVPALLKGHVRKGPRKNCRSSVRGPGKTSRSRIDGRSLKQWQIKGNVERGTPRGRTCERKRRTRPECNSGIWRLNKTSGNGVRERIMKRDQRLETKRTRCEATRQDQRLEIVRIAADCSTRL
jgi:hypothetical protein